MSRDGPNGGMLGRLQAEEAKNAPLSAGFS